MQNLVPRTITLDLAAVQAEVAALSAEELERELVACLAQSAANLLRQAALVYRLEHDYGRDLSHLKGLRNQLEYLRLIACGRLHPWVLVNYGENRPLVRLLASLPYAEQERVVNGGKFRLLTWAPDGSVTHRMVTPADLVKENLVDQVLAPGRIRDDAEQRSWLDARRLKDLAAKTPERVGQFANIDPVLGTATIGRHTVSRAELRAVLRALGPSSR